VIPLAPISATERALPFEIIIYDEFLKQKSSTGFYILRVLVADEVFLKSHSFTVPSEEALRTVC
jgi:hypothetical protein